jgi:hypothetical protein
MTVALLGFLVLHTVGCAPSPADDAAQDEQAAPPDPVVPSGTAKALLELDNGKRWAMSPSMLPPVRRMQERIAEAGQAGILDHAALADSLFVDIDALVAGCTMEGKAHAELHDWLMPHMQLVQELERTTDTAQARNILQQLAASSAEFDRYFE